MKDNTNKNECISKDIHDIIENKKRRDFVKIVTRSITKRISRKIWAKNYK